MTKEIALLQNQIEALKKQNVVALGENEVFALTGQDGQVRAFKRNLHLSTEEGTLVKIGYNPNSPIIISAQGFEKWADAVGASVIFPKDVLVGSTLKPNPYVERDEKNGRVLAVHARAVAFKFSAMGLPQVCDWSTIFDVPSYRMIDLLAKAKKQPQAFKLLPKGIEPKADNNETWAKYDFDESTSLWLNTSHNEVLDWFSSIINREKKAMDFAQTFARRNALKHLSGIQKAPTEQWSVSVIAWKPTGNNIVQWNAAQYSQLQDRVSSMIDGDASEFAEGETKQLEVRKGKETISAELDEAEINEDVNPDDPIEMESLPEEKPLDAVEKAELTKHQKKAVDLEDQFPDEYKDARFRLKIVESTYVLTDEQCEAIFKEVNSILDGENNK